MGQEKIGVLGYGAGERVFNGDYGGGYGPALETVEHFGGPGAGDDLAAWQHSLGGFVAEGSWFALNGDFDGGFHLHGKVAGVGGFAQIRGLEGNSL
jgi:hypothetical protein